MKTVYQDENNIVLDENSVKLKPCINRESKSLELTIELYSFHNINMKFLVVVTPPSMYQYYLVLNIKKFLVKTIFNVCLLLQMVIIMSRSPLIHIFYSHFIQMVI